MNWGAIDSQQQNDSDMARGKSKNLIHGLPVTCVIFKNDKEDNIDACKGLGKGSMAMNSSMIE